MKKESTAFLAQKAPSLDSTSKNVRALQRGGLAAAVAQVLGNSACSLVLLALAGSAVAQTYTYNPTTASDTWSTGTNWDAPPVSGIDTNLLFMPAGGFFPGSVTNTNTNDLGTFQLNQLVLTGTGAAEDGSPVVVNITGGILDFNFNSGFVAPTIVLDASNGLGAGSTVTYNVSSDITLTGDTTVSGSGNAGFIFSGVISGAGGLTKTGNSTLTLSGTNSYSGLTNIIGGTLAYGASNVLGNGDVIVNGPTAVLAMGANSDTVGYVTLDGGGSITGTGTLTSTGSFEMSSGSASVGLAGTVGLNKYSSGTLALSGSNTYTGVTTLFDGVLNLGSAGALGGGGEVTFFGGTVQYTAANTSDLSARIVNSGGAISLDLNGQTVTYASALAATNTGGLTLNGTGGGTLILGAANNYVGTTTVASGTLQYGTSNAIGSGDVIINGAAAVLDLGANSDTVGTVILDGEGSIIGSGTLTSTGSFEMTSGTVSASLAGAVALNKNFAGTVTLSGTNTYSGLTSLNGGILGLGSAGALGGGGNITFAGGTLQYSAANTSDLSSRIVDSMGPISIDVNGQTVTFASSLAGSNTGGLTLLGTGGGTLILNAAAAYTGPTTVTSGTLQFGTNDAIGSGDLTVNGGTVELGAFNATVGVVTLIDGSISGSTGVLNTMADSFEFQNGSVSAILAGSGAGVNKTSGGTVTLSGANTYSGATTISGGVLKISAANNLGDGSATNTIVLNGGTLNSTSGTYALGTNRTIALNGSATIQTDAGGELTVDGAVTTNAGTLTVQGGGSTLISGAIGGGPGGVTVTGAGTVLTLSGSNTYTGATTLNNGTLNLANAGALGGGGALTLAGGTLDNTAGMPLVLGDNPVNFNGNFSFSTADGTTNNSLTFGTGAISIAASRTITLNGLGALAFGGIMTNTGDSNRTLTVNLGGGTGATTLLTLGGIELTGPGSTGARVFTIAGSANVTIAGLISDGVSAGSGLTKSAAATTLTLTSTNTYTGNTTISGGTVVIGADNVFGTTGQLRVAATSTPLVSSASTATLQTDGEARTIANAFTETSGAGDLSWVIAGTGDLTFTGKYTRSSSGNGGIVINNSGITRFSGGIDGSGGNPRNIYLRGSGNIVIDTTPITNGASTNVVMQYGGTRSGTNFASSTNTYTATLNVASSYTGNTFIHSGTIYVGVSAPATEGAGMDGVFGNDAGTIAFGSADSAGLDVALLTNGAVTIARPFSVSNNGANSGANTFGGNTDNNSAFTGAIAANRSIRITQVATTGGNKLTFGNFSVSGTRLINFDNIGDVEVAGVISGAGGITKTSAGDLTLAGNNTYSGTTSVTGGTLFVGNGGTAGTLGNGTGAVTNDTLINFNRTNAFTIGNAIGGAGAIDMLGTGTLILTGANSYAGATTITAGTVQIGNGGANGTLGAGAVINNSVLAFNRNNALTVANAIDGSGTVTQLGAGTTTLTGTNSYLGTTTLANGALNVGSAGALGGGGNITFTGGALQYSTANTDDFSARIVNSTGPIKIDVNGQTVSYGTTLDASNTGGLTVLGTGGGALILNVPNAYTGLTTVTSGTLQYGANDIIGSGDVTVNGATAILDLGAFSDTVGTVTLNGNGSIIGEGTLTSTSDFDVRSGFASAALAGAASLTKTTAGLVTLAGTNTYSGTTSVNNGVLNLGSAGALGGGGNVTFGGGTLQYSAANTSDLSNRIVNSTAGPIKIDPNGQEVTYASALAASNTGGLALAAPGGGTLILTGANSYSGGTTVSGGILQVGDGGTTGTLGSGTVTTDASLVFNRSDTLTVADDITGTGNITNDGGASNILNLNGAQSEAVLYANSGTTNVNGAFTNGTSAVNVANDAMVNFGSSQMLGSLTIGDGAVVTLFQSTPVAELTTPSVATVPEPGTLGLLLVSALGFMTRRQRRNSQQ